MAEKYEKDKNYLRNPCLHVPHSVIAGKVQSWMIRWTSPVRFRPELVIKCRHIKVRTKTVITERCGSSCRLCFSTFPHPEVLMAVVKACSLISAGVDAGDVFRGGFGIHRPSQAVKGWPRRIARIDSFDQLMTQLRADFKAKSWSETEAEHEQSVVISNLLNFSQQNCGDVIEPPCEYKIIGDNRVLGVIHEDDATAAMLVQLFDQVRHPRRPNAFLPTVNDDREISGRITAERCEVSVERRYLHISRAGDDTKTSMLEDAGKKFRSYLLVDENGERNRRFVLVQVNSLAVNQSHKQQNINYSNHSHGSVHTRNSLTTDRLGHLSITVDHKGFHSWESVSHFGPSKKKISKKASQLSYLNVFEIRDIMARLAPLMWKLWRRRLIVHKKPRDRNNRFVARLLWSRRLFCCGSMAIKVWIFITWK